MAFGISKNSLKKATVSKGSGVLRSAKRAASSRPVDAPAPGTRDPRQIAGPAANIAAPTYETPGAMGAVTPIAAPPVVSDPFLSPTDLANQAIDLASVDQYLGNVDLTVNNARTDAGIKTAQIDTSEGRNLEAADWNNAARGLAQSSIKDTQKANLSADAAAARSGTADSLKNAENYGSGEHVRADTVVRPAIHSKYDEKAKQDAQDRTDAWNADPAHQGHPATAPAASTVPQISGTPGGTAQDRAAPNTSDPSQIAGPGGVDWKPVVKGGNFYHYYPKTGVYMYIRKAS